MEFDLDLVQARQFPAEVARQYADNAARIVTWLDLRCRVPGGQRRPHRLADRTEVHQAHLRTARSDRQFADRGVGGGERDRLHEVDLNAVAASGVRIGAQNLLLPSTV